MGSSKFPEQNVLNSKKNDEDYGMRVAKAIESEWFSSSTSGRSRFVGSQQSFHNLRLYARGEQPIGKYKNEISIDGDLSYLNLDWKPVSIIPKFVDIVVNGISERMFNPKAQSIDHNGVDKRTCLLYTSPSPRDGLLSRMPSSA